MNRALSILSGGLDSVVSTAIARNRHDLLLAVTFDYGQQAAVKEIEAASYFCRKWNIEHRVVGLNFLSEIGGSALTSKSAHLPKPNRQTLDNIDTTSESARQVWVPNRNGIFVSIAAAIAEAEGFDWIIAGFNREEAGTFPDNSPQFIAAANNLLKHSTLSQPSLVSYVIDMDKKEIFGAALKLEVEVDRTWPCYDGGKKWCGECESCTRILRAMTGTNEFIV